MQHASAAGSVHQSLLVVVHATCLCYCICASVTFDDSVCNIVCCCICALVTGISTLCSILLLCTDIGHSLCTTWRAMLLHIPDCLVLCAQQYKHMLSVQRRSKVHQHSHVALCIQQFPQQDRKWDVKSPWLESQLEHVLFRC